MAVEEYRCDQEDCHFITRSKLQRKEHSLSHSKDKQTCELCSKDFASLRSLKVHEGRIHSKKKNVESSEAESVPEIDQDQKEDFAEASKPPNLNVSSEKPLIHSAKANETIEDKAKNKQNSLTPKVELKQRKRKPKLSLLVKADSPLFKENGGKEAIKEGPSEVLRQKILDSTEHDVDPSCGTVTGEKKVEKNTLAIPCHCVKCLPCTSLCCDNPPVRSGRCCDPSTLGQCLQPYQVTILQTGHYKLSHYISQPQCYAPCCHPTVSLRQQFRYVGGSVHYQEPWLLTHPVLLTDEERDETEAQIYENARSRADQLGLTLTYFDLDEDISDIEDQEDESGLLEFSSSDDVETEQEDELDSQQGRSYSYKLPGPNPLLSCSKVFHSYRNNKLVVLFRSSCGRYFGSQEKLVSFLRTKHRDDSGSLSSVSSSSDSKTGKFDPSSLEEKRGLLEDMKDLLTGQPPTSQGSADRSRPRPVKGDVHVSDKRSEPSSETGAKSNSIVCHVCKVEVPTKLITKHFLTHGLQQANSTTPTKINKKNKDNYVETDALNSTCPSFPRAGTSQQKEPAKVKRSRSSSATGGPRKYTKKTGSGKEGQAKRGRKVGVTK